MMMFQKSILNTFMVKLPNSISQEFCFANSVTLLLASQSIEETSWKLSVKLPVLRPSQVFN